MKVYIIVENDCEYNDSDYDLRNGGEPVKVYRNKSNADDRCHELSKAKADSGDFPIDRYSSARDYFKVVELEVEDSEVTGYDLARQKMKKAREEAQATVKAAFAEGAAELFAKHPALESFSWTQYTPYFNDGDECVFSVHADEPDINGVDGYDVSEEDAALAPTQSEVSKFIAGFDEEDLRFMFGDHTQVTAYRDGRVETDRHDHD